MATFIFGVGLATMRLPFWLPIVATSAIVWCFGGSLTAIILGEKFRVASQWPRAEEGAFVLFIGLTISSGLLLVWATYRRWVRSDVA